MSGNQFPFGETNIFSFPVNVLDNSYRRGEFAQFTDIFEILVHLLVTDDREGQSIKVECGIFVQNSLGHFIDRNIDWIVRLDGGQADISVLDVRSL